MTEDLTKHEKNAIARIRNGGGYVMRTHRRQTLDGETLPIFTLGYTAKTIGPSVLGRLIEKGAVIPNGDALLDGCDQSFRVAS